MFSDELIVSQSIAEQDLTLRISTDSAFNDLLETKQFLSAQQLVIVDVNQSELFRNLDSFRSQTIVRGSNAYERLNGTDNQDIILGRGGQDYITGGPSNDVLRGGKDRDFLKGQSGDDQVFGNRDDDALWGNAGNDRLRGDHGDDLVLGGQGNDIALGGTGEDRLFGNEGDDWLYGNPGKDYLDGGIGSDRLSGGGGDDILNGGDGIDVLSGGEGKDVFVISQRSGGKGLEHVDVILDFTPGKDRLALTGSLDEEILELMQGEGEWENDTLILDARQNQYLAILKNVLAEEISEANFVRIESLPTPETSEAGIPPLQLDDVPSPDPGPSDPGPSDPGPSDPGPSDPGPSDPGPSDPGPSDPGPSDPGPSDPGPSDPGPSDPGPSDPGPSDPGPSDPGPSDPGPSDPGPSDPGPSDPGPSDPGPSDPGPSDPGPSDPGPSDPGPGPSPGGAAPVASVVNEVVKFSPSTSEAAIAALGGAKITIGTQTIYIGTQQVSSINQNPIIASFDSSNPSKNWVKTDYEATGADGRGYGLFWSGSSLYGIFSVDGTQGTVAQDFRRASGDAVQSWLRSYGRGGGPKVSVIGRIDPQTGALLDAAYLSAVLSSGNSNSLVVKNVSVNGAGNLVIQAQSYFSPRRPNGQAMTQVGSGSSPFDYTVEIKPDLSEVVRTSAVGWA